MPLLEPRKLGRLPTYETQPLKQGCLSGKRRDRFAADQRTRPFDDADRPPGLYLDEGFALDILTDAQGGRKRLAPDGSLAGVPAYYAVERLASGKRPTFRFSYWLLFGRGRAIEPGTGEPVEHEGDWERVDVVARRIRADVYQPIAVRYRVGDRFDTVPWSDVELAGPGGAHPVAYLARASHTPRPRPTDDRRSTNLSWKTWESLRDVRREPWFGYGGGWGARRDTDATSGPLGPSPFELKAPPKVAGDWV